MPSLVSKLVIGALGMFGSPSLESQRHSNPSCGDGSLFGLQASPGPISRPYAFTPEVCSTGADNPENAYRCIQECFKVKPKKEFIQLQKDVSIATGEEVVNRLLSVFLDDQVKIRALLHKFADQEGSFQDEFKLLFEYISNCPGQHSMRLVITPDYAETSQLGSGPPHSHYPGQTLFLSEQSEDLPGQKQNPTLFLKNFTYSFTDKIEVVPGQDFTIYQDANVRKAIFYPTCAAPITSTRVPHNASPRKPPERPEKQQYRFFVQIFTNPASEKGKDEL